MPLAHPAGGGELVGVAGDTDVGELVDVVEDQIGKAAELSGGEAGLDGGGAEVVPGGAGADPIGGGQRVHRPTAADRKSTSELQSLMRISYAVFCLKKKNQTQ